MLFLGHKLPNTNARLLIKGSKGEDSCLICFQREKQLSRKQPIVGTLDIWSKYQASESVVDHVDESFFVQTGHEMNWPLFK